MVKSTEEKYLQELLDSLRSHDHEQMLAAVLKLREAGWLTDGTLTGINLASVDLTGANLFGGELRGVDLTSATLRGANLSRICLADANLYKADLRDANLWGANLQKATLCQANLQGANLQGVDLSGADLLGVNLAGLTLDSRYLGMATYSTETRLPDGIFWTREVDMARYTNPSDENR